ncbi:MAG: acetolactate synthase small subunit [Saprospiraceae bacterium]
MKEYTITAFSEHQTGIMQRVVSIFTRRHINIDSLSVSKSSIQGIHRFTIVVHVSEEMVKKLVAQIEKQIDVVKAFYDTNENIVHQELALYKVPTEAFANGNKVEKLIRSYNARILAIETEYIVVEKTGHPRDTESLLEEFKKIGIYEFVRSGRVAIVKPMERLNKYLQSLEVEEEMN